VEIAIDGAELGTEDALEGDGSLLDDGHLEPSLARRGADLGADPARSDGEHLAASPDPFADGIGVGEVAQIEDPLEVRTRARRPAWLRAGREEEPVERKALRAIELDLAPPRDRGR